MPDFCIYQDKCIKINEQGCFLALIKRKLVTRLDEKYLILMAERRGLFGDTNPKKPMQRPPTKISKKDEIAKTSTSNRTKKKKGESITVLVRIYFIFDISLKKFQLLKSILVGSLISTNLRVY